jgi:hypothetical protein
MRIAFCKFAAALVYTFDSFHKVLDHQRSQHSNGSNIVAEFFSICKPDCFRHIFLEEHITILLTDKLRQVLLDYS